MPIFSNNNRDKPTPVLRFKTAELEARLQPICIRVISQFETPPLRLLCYCDDQQPRVYGVGTFHGIFAPVTGSGDVVPEYVKQLFFASHGDFAFDAFIYMPASTYSSNDIGFALLFAHEFQHSVQYGNTRETYEANARRFAQLSWLGSTAKSWEVPYERDAMITSKRVAEVVYSPQTVMDYIDSQISGGNSEKKELWNLLRGLNPADKYDWVRESASIQEFRSSVPNEEEE